MAVVLGIVMVLGACGTKEEPAQPKEETKPAAAEESEGVKEEPVEAAKEEAAVMEQEGNYLIGISTDSEFEARGWEVQELYRKAEESGGKVEIIQQVADGQENWTIVEIETNWDTGEAPGLQLAVDGYTDKLCVICSTKWEAKSMIR